VAFLPLILGVITMVHVLLVRKRGVVPPIDVIPDYSLPDKKGDN
jgi:hypothetical protein